MVASRRRLRRPASKDWPPFGTPGEFHFPWRVVGARGRSQCEDGAGSAPRRPWRGLPCRPAVDVVVVDTGNSTNLSWLLDEGTWPCPKSLQVVIYANTDLGRRFGLDKVELAPGTTVEELRQLALPAAKADEAPKYLHHIIASCYDEQAPEHVLFLHSNQHSDGIADKQNLLRRYVAGALPPEAREAPYWPLNWEMGRLLDIIPSEIFGGDPSKARFTEEVRVIDAFKGLAAPSDRVNDGSTAGGMQLVGHLWKEWGLAEELGPLPRWWQSHCCAHFVASGPAIRRHPIDFYLRLFMILTQGPALPRVSFAHRRNTATESMIMEFLWKPLFAANQKAWVPAEDDEPEPAPLDGLSELGADALEQLTFEQLDELKRKRAKKKK